MTPREVIARSRFHPLSIQLAIAEWNICDLVSALRNEAELLASDTNNGSNLERYAADLREWRRILSLLQRERDGLKPLPGQPARDWRRENDDYFRPSGE